MLNKKGFNLIQKELELQENVKNERDWYTLFNVVFVCVAISLCVASYLVESGLQSDLDNKAQELANKINKNLSTTSKSIIKSKVNNLNDRFGLYKDAIDQNFDLNKFYNELSGIYPSLKIETFVIDPNTSKIQATLSLNEGDYDKIPAFIAYVEKNEKFKNMEILNISFQSKNASLNPNTPASQVPYPTDVSVLKPIIRIALDKSVTK